tara:strand:- start:1949 stop:2467 length:519 start_codon:yes stop_codon:yes gene_type:complete
MKFKSFSSTLRGFMQGDVSSDSLMNADSVEFNCARVHLFPTKEMQDKLGRTYPSEVLSYVIDEFNTEAQHGIGDLAHYKFQRHILRIGRYECSQAPAEMVSEIVREGYERFISIIEQLDKKGFVSFRKKLESVDYALAEHLLFQSFNDLYGPDGKNEQTKKKYYERLAAESS